MTFDDGGNMHVALCPKDWTTENKPKDTWIVHVPSGMWNDYQRVSRRAREYADKWMKLFIAVEMEGKDETRYG